MSSPSMLGPARRPGPNGPNRRRLHLAIVSMFPPRRSASAEYTAELCRALSCAAPDIAVSICAVGSGPSLAAADVAATIRMDDPTDYRRAAHRLAVLGADAVLIEHESGAYGGPHGRYILGLVDELGRLGVPFLVTLHTVRTSPPPDQADVIAALCRPAAGVTVMSDVAVRLLTAHRLAAPEQIAVIPHGAPPELSVDPVQTAIHPDLSHALAAAHGEPMLSTFGLLSPGKSIEVAIAALARIHKTHPGVHYVVAGATHPAQLRRCGEGYRLALQRLSAGLGLSQHVHLIDAYLSAAELATLLRRTDIYVTTYPQRGRTSSGTLTYALAAGCPIVSTDHNFARDLVTSEVGALVPPGDPERLADAVTALLTDGDRLAVAREAARRRGAQLSWSELAEQIAGLVRFAARRNAPATAAPTVSRPNGGTRRVRAVLSGTASRGQRQDRSSRPLPGARRV